MFAAYLGLMAAPGRVEDITADQVRLLGFGTTAGVALQALALVPFARAAGFRFRPRFDWRGTGLGRSVHAAKWTLLFVLANQVALTVVTNFANGAADAASVRPLGHMLQAFGPGLIAFSAQYLLLRGFYAFEDTRTPFFMAAWIAGVNIALASACHLLLPARWAVVGMAGAYTLSYLAGLALTARLLRRRLGGRIGAGGLGRAYGKLLCAAAPAAGLGWCAARAVSGPGGPGAAGTWSAAVALACGVLSTAVAYLLLARLLKVEEVRRLPGLR